MVVVVVVLLVVFSVHSLGITAVASAAPAHSANLLPKPSTSSQGLELLPLVVSVGTSSSKRVTILFTKELENAGGSGFLVVHCL